MPDMKLSGILTDKKAAILKKWFEVIMESYPSGTSNHLNIQGDSFANPAGTTISRGIEGIFEELLIGPNGNNPSGFSGDIVRIMAVQDFLPSRALAFFFSLKKIIREELRSEMTGELSHELLSLESRIDGLALSAFDIFMKCREKIYEIRANELKRANFRHLQRADVINAVPKAKKS
jgi:hypothetical protein